jgi:hypothetical protein
MRHRRLNKDRDPVNVEFLLALDHHVSRLPRVF